MAEAKTITMDYTKSTKQTYVYSENSDDPTVPTLYIRRSQMPSKPPEKITVTIEHEG